MDYKKAILKFIPRRLHRIVRDMYFIGRMLPNYAYDFGRYLAYSGLNKSRGYRSEREARITLFYHQVEKGLSLASPRPGFGMLVIPRLLNDIDAFFSDYGVEAPATTAVAALLGYVKHHELINHDCEYVRSELQRILLKHRISEETARRWEGGVITVSRRELEAARSAGFKDFFESRYSVRNFSGEQVKAEDIRCAVELAQKTPSVCNRQSWRVHAFADGDKIAALLQIQSGSRGFGEKAATVLVITCELGSFVEVSERYQAWIDGGMFSLAVCLALHDMGYGTCCLNWSKESGADRALRATANIPDSEQIIMLIAVGGLPETLNVARSARPPVERCLVLH